MMVLSQKDPELIYIFFFSYKIREVANCMSVAYVKLRVTSLQDRTRVDREKKISVIN